MFEVNLLFIYFSVFSVKQQAKMANYCRTIFGDMLLVDPLEGFEVKYFRQSHRLC